MNSIIENNKLFIDKLCKENKVDKLYVFGSVLTENFNTESDLDFVVSINTENPLEYSDCFFGLLYGFENLFNKKIDLLEEKSLLNPYFIKGIKSKKAVDL